MATVIWTGATDTDWNTGTNWSGAAVPSVSDDVVITGSVSIAGLVVTNQCGNLEVVDYTGNLGSAGTPLAFGPADGFDDNARVSISGTGQMYLDLGEGATTGTATAPIVTIKKTKSGTQSTPYGLYLTALKLQSLTILGGSVAVGSEEGDAVEIITVTIDDVQSTPKVLLGKNLTITATTGAIYIFSGTNIIDAAAIIALLDVNGGTTTKKGEQTTTLLQMRGGTLIHNLGTVTTVHFRGGLFDLSQSTDARTITASILYRGGAYKIGVNPPFLVTYSSVPQTDVTASMTVRAS